jgi:hypothetical protein
MTNAYSWGRSHRGQIASFIFACSILGLTNIWYACTQIHDINNPAYTDRVNDSIDTAVDVEHTITSTANITTEEPTLVSQEEMSVDIVPVPAPAPASLDDPVIEREANQTTKDAAPTAPANIPLDMAVSVQEELQEDPAMVPPTPTGTPMGTNKTRIVRSSIIAIFFNTFSSINNTKNANDIITSQLREINSQPLLHGAPVYYARVGDLDWEWPVSECRRGYNNDNDNTNINITSPSHGHTHGHSRRQCTEIAAVPEGDEMLSLQPLYEYCVQHKRDRVVYMHSKGTYTVSNKNNQLRTILMKAIMSNECLELPDKCDTCSTRFTLFPFFTYTGNMWVANCSYISKLIPPKDYGSSKQRVIATMKNNDTTTPIDNNNMWYQTKLDNVTSYKFRARSMSWIDRGSWMGVERYASEHWIGSHPDLKPCEVFGHDENPPIAYGRKIKIHEFKPPNLQKIQDTMTTNASEAFWVHRGQKQYVYHPWYAKDGRLYEYKNLYSKVPQNDSWFYTLWSRFPTPDDWLVNNKE